jgi:aspartate dehydrogenase
MNSEIRVSLIGFGAMGRALAGLLRRQGGVRIVAVAKREPLSMQSLDLLQARTLIVHSPEELVAIDADLVVECAGHDALREYAVEVLRGGRDLLLASVGALADHKLESSLREEAQRSGAQIRIPSGALGGLDVLAAARVAGLEAVTYMGRKPPCAWKGTSAEALVDLDDPAVGFRPFFEGTAREAAVQFPQNANVAAAVSLAGIGFEATRVTLSADHATTGNEHTVEAQGVFGQFRIFVRGNSLPDNPKTSLLAPASLARSVVDLHETVALA